MAEDLHIGGAFLTALGLYAQAGDAAVREAAELGRRTLQEDLQALAREHPRWHQLADHIQVWDQEGRLVIGVSSEVQSEAMTAEYGDAEHPPAPILRNHPAARQHAVDVMNAHILSIPGISA